jgi:DNA-binding GntR family transcriptional regulator
MSCRASISPKLPITRAERVRLRLAAEIAGGEFRAGTRLDEVFQANRMGVSRTPLREAVRQLASLGMVENRPHRGVVVADRVGEALFEALGEIEAVCVAFAALRMTAHERTEMAIAAATNGDWLRTLHRGVGNSILAGVLETLWQPILEDESGNQRPLMAPESRRAMGTRVASAVIAGNAVQAAAAIREFVQATAAAFIGAPPAGRRQGLADMTLG